MSGVRQPSKSRWPAFVYRAGDEPDYRFSFANERTFLAWIRTALALLAAGLATDRTALAWQRTALAATAGAAIVVALMAAVGDRKSVV